MRRIAGCRDGAGVLWRRCRNRRARTPDPRRAPRIPVARHSPSIDRDLKPRAREAGDAFGIPVRAWIADARARSIVCTMPGSIGAFLQARRRRAGTVAQAAERYLQVRHREGAATTVHARRRAREAGHPHAPIREAEHRATTRGDRVDVEHGRLQARAGEVVFDALRDVTGVHGYVGRGATHVEADQRIETESRADARHAGQAAGGAGQHARRGAKTARLDETPRALHAQQLRAAIDGARVGRDPLQPAAERRREIGIEHGRSATRDVAHERRLRARRSTRSRLPRERGRARLVPGAVAV